MKSSVDTFFNPGLVHVDATPWLGFRQFAMIHPVAQQETLATNTWSYCYKLANI